MDLLTVSPTLAALARRAAFLHSLTDDELVHVLTPILFHVEPGQPHTFTTIPRSPAGPGWCGLCGFPAGHSIHHGGRP